jgi:tRNA uridine 5-carboxymethylaminomethyl modification enzyme
MERYQVIVIGAGHAGCEAALAASRMGMNTLLVTMSLDSVARMSCNPAIGGLAKGQIVREVDALGGEMAKVTDRAGLQFRMLNLSRGPAVRSPRAQCDKRLYHEFMLESLKKQANLELLEDEAIGISSLSGAVSGIVTRSGKKLQADAVIVTTGTFLNGLIHVGLKHFPGGRIGEAPANSLSGSLRGAGLEVSRLKTGTPPRIDSASVDFSKTEPQPGDDPPVPFSFSTDPVKFRAEKKQLNCWLTYTNPSTHDIIKNNLDRSPLYAGVIQSTGPRYCPSIEDKVVRFPSRERHHVFLEPEGYDTNELYANGISTSLPEDVQEAIVHSIKGLENAKILRYGYAIEYDYCPPTQLYATLETKTMKNLYLAGQINGTTGYEEAAGQGIAAGINAALKLKGKDPFIMKRDESYTGVLIDDLVTKGADEPYRMFTSRAEYRLLIRSDNADLRLMDYGHDFGLISDDMHLKFSKYRSAVAAALANKPREHPADEELRPWSQELIEEEVRIEKKYEGYIKKQRETVKKFKRMEDKRIPPRFDYDSIPSLLGETRQKFKKINPLTIGQASRISGVTPADIAVLMIYLEKR